MRYTFRGGFPSKGQDAKMIFTHLETVRGKNAGILRPADVIDDARSAASPLHPYFDWEDSTAAEKWRQVQAQNLIKAIIIIPDKQPSKAVQKAFVTLKEDKDADALINLKESISREDHHSMLIDRGLGELKAWRETYRDYQGLLALFCTIEETVKDFRGLKIGNAIADIQAWRKKYRAFEEFGELFERIDLVLEDFEHDPAADSLPDIQIQKVEEKVALVEAK